MRHVTPYIHTEKAAKYLPQFAEKKENPWGCGLKIIKDYEKFMDATYPMAFEEFDELDINPDTRIGIFTNGRYGELLEFCKANPKFHIQSAFYEGAEIIINAPVPDACQYFLCSGDSDPELVWFPTLSRDTRLLLEFLEFDRD